MSICPLLKVQLKSTTTHLCTRNCLMALCPGLPGWASARITFNILTFGGRLTGNRTVNESQHIYSLDNLRYFRHNCTKSSCQICIQHITLMPNEYTIEESWKSFLLALLVDYKTPLKSVTSCEQLQKEISSHRARGNKLHSWHCIRWVCGISKLWLCRREKMMTSSS